MKHAAVTYAADGAKIEGRGDTLPTAVRDAQNKLRIYNAAVTKRGEVKTQSFGGVNVVRN